ncbi:hypothetical protein AX16_004221 [Volvariella volvacea WC 439]|nr:hypothetical protein AX16_004221 [Volvariella volvacea WC 439]
MTAVTQDAIVLFGDSITQGSFEPGKEGYGQALAHAYVRKLDVVNRGFSGYNTRWALTLFEQLFARKAEQPHVPKVKLLVIWFGANDACIPPSSQHVPLEEYRSNLKRFIELIRSPASPHHSPETRIALITPPPVNTIQWNRGDRLFDVTRQYAGAVLEIGREEDVPVVDVWTALWKAAGETEQALSEYLSDGLHLTATGYKVVHDALDKTILEKYPEIHHSSLSTVYPYWDAIDFANPASSLVKRAL